MWLKTLQKNLEEIEEKIEEGDFDGASSQIAKVLRRWKSSSEARTLAGEIAFVQGSPEKASKHFRKAIDLSAYAAHAWCGLGKALLELNEREESLEAALEAVRLHDDDPESIYSLGMTLEVQGAFEEAEESYREAHRLNPSMYFLPYRVSRDTFDSYVQTCLAQLPSEVEEALSRTQIDVYDIPADREVDDGEKAIAPLSLGVFIGYSRTEESLEDPWSTAFPSQICLFQRNIERACPDREELIRQIRITLLHEIGHLLGLDESELEARGLD